MTPQKLLFSLLFSFVILMSTLVSEAQNVRPPENSVRSVTPEASGTSNTLGSKSQSDYWRGIRQGGAGLAANKKFRLIQSRGEDWRLFRLNYILKYSGWILSGVVGAIFLFFLVRGKIRIKNGKSGKVLPRFTLNERVIHWYTASTFILLAVSGLILMLGRPFLLPLIGKDAFGIVASGALQGHNLFGPLFVLAIILLFFAFVRGNMLQWVDIKWVLKGGGFFGGHVSSHRYNFGEKTWFWLAVLVGVLMSVTGVAMLVPWALPSLIYLQGATLLHGIAAVLLIAAAFGHIYIGTIGMEGALEGMTTGTVDENWAKEHHDLWYEAHQEALTEDKTQAAAKAAHGEV